ncbi:hypothetical protein MPNT_120012 [Candidatus Methylacidithermus pantelleriae]|uniref:Uncharacterized protein n=1 Tax=Candidatus Methylacidithermus pantelleriae TaxID=2744239 RepID=A0A8J2BJF5_9BACT|nr:hypothetical protein MPNT_120012 [Candidatus Methylacidithermus pantelleriae]
MRQHGRPVWWVVWVGGEWVDLRVCRETSKRVQAGVEEIRRSERAGRESGGLKVREF